MKKLFAVLLALGLIMAVSAPASAVDVKVSGSYFLAGAYDDNPSLAENAYSRAYFYQRLRVEPVFQIAEGLTFTARFDAMEKQWGNIDWNGTDDQTNSQKINNAVGNPKIQESLEMERGYVTFNTGIGQFSVGYMEAGTFGTVFSDSVTTRPRIKYVTKAGPLTLIAIYEKRVEAQKNVVLATDKKTDADYDAYYLAPLYFFKGGQTGILYGYLNNASNRPAANVRTQLHLFEPYVKATFGSVYVEAEVDYVTGKNAKFETPAVAADVDRSGWAAYLKAQTDMGPATIGAQFGWSQGDDPTTLDKNEAGLGGGYDWNPALILMAYDMTFWSNGGDVNSNAGTYTKNNMWLWNIFANYKVTPKFSVGAALTYMKADKVAAGWDKDMGTEFDVTATYKLYDNLTYMVGAGYLWTGDFYKSGVAAAKIDNDYVLINKLTLNF